MGKFQIPKQVTVPVVVVLLTVVVIATALEWSSWIIAAVAMVAVAIAFLRKR